MECVDPPFEYAPHPRPVLDPELETPFPRRTSASSSRSQMERCPCSPTGSSTTRRWWPSFKKPRRAAPPSPETLERMMRAATEDTFDLLRGLYYDTALSANPTVLSALQRLVPASRVLLGTDYSFAQEIGVRYSLDGLGAYEGFGEEERAMIYFGSPIAWRTLSSWMRFCRTTASPCSMPSRNPCARTSSVRSPRTGPLAGPGRRRRGGRARLVRRPGAVAGGAYGGLYPGRTVSEPAHMNRSLAQQRATYIACTFETSDDVAAIREEPSWTFRALHTGHWPMVSAPDELVALLANVASEHGRS